MISSQAAIEQTQNHNIETLCMAVLDTSLMYLLVNEAKEPHSSTFVMTPSPLCRLILSPWI